MYISISIYKIFIFIYTSIKNWMGPYQRTPKWVAGVIRYSGLGVRSVGPVGDFLEYTLLPSSRYFKVFSVLFVFHGRSTRLAVPGGASTNLGFERWDTRGGSEDSTWDLSNFSPADRELPGELFFWWNFLMGNCEERCFERGHDHLFR